jgi:exodeoxyribonuclease V gamma subunit
MDESSISQRFLAGMVNFCTMMPMRAIPFKVVCLLGMNDGQYPRSRPAPDFDLMSVPGLYRPGDRSRREDDRYFFLEAVLSARNLLYISYIGRSVRDNSERMPSVLVAQLQDYLAAGWKLSGEMAEAGRPVDPLLSHLTCQHPLQPFSTCYFLPDRAAGLFTYAHEWRGALKCRQEVAIGTQPLSCGRFESSLQLSQLIRFVKNPVKYFFNQRLKVHFDPVRTAACDQEPFCLDALAPFRLGQKLLEAGLAVDSAAGAEAVRQAAERLRRTGELPLNGFGELSAAQLAAPVQDMLAHHHELLRRWPLTAEALEIRLPVQVDGCDGGILEDWLDGLHRADPQSPGTAQFGGYARWEFYSNSIMGSNGRVARLYSLIGLWVRHLSGCAQGMELASFMVAPDGVARLQPLDRQVAGRWLTEIVAHGWLGLTQPLPVTARTALAYLHELQSDDPGNLRAENAARKAYEGDGYHNRGELGYSDGVYLKRCYPDFDTLWQAHDHYFLKLVKSLYEPLASALLQV